MPLRDELSIHCSAERVELTVELEAPETDAPAELAREVDATSRAHRRLAMVDPDLVDDPELGVASVVECRDAVPDPLVRALSELGFRHEVRAGGGAGGWGGRRRDTLHRFVASYVRASDQRRDLARLEEAVSEVDEAERLEALDRALGLAPDDVRGLEAQLGLRAAERLVLAPELIDALAHWVGRALARRHPQARAHPDAAHHWLLPAPAGATVETDVEFRVLEHVLRGPRASLATYLDGL